MKTKLLLFAAFGLLASGFNIQAQTDSTGKKMVVVYFSHSGNTRQIANQIKDATGADLFEIQPQKAYPSDYKACVDQAKKEINAGFKPVLKTDLKEIAQYDVIFVGSPCWWSTIAPPVATFLSSHDLSGKTIVPFITHEGSRMGRTATDIKKLCPQSTVLDGLPINGKAVKTAQNDVQTWLRRIKMAKQ